MKVGGHSYATAYGYVAGGYGTHSTTGLVASLTQSGENFSYTYDNVGNIASVTQNGKTTSYVYDNLGQLTRVNDQNDTTSGATGTTWEYEYDRGGNILTKKRYAYTTGTVGTALQTINYTYGDSNWKDKLTKYNGTTITYDAIGNPTGDGTWTYTWQNGRQLQQMSRIGTTASFVYNAEGLRVQKTVNNVITNYTLHGKNIVHMTQGSNTLHFWYDAQNRPAIVQFNGTKYAYIHNLQGDIVGLLDSTGTEVVKYTYDAWGKVLSTTGSLASTLGAVQPFRYRGYVYDVDTGLYYLRSRYYNPTWNRFINSDKYISTRQYISCYNIFVYCRNNPVNRKDPTGQFGITALMLIAVVGVCAVALSGCSPQPTSDVGAALPYVDMLGSDDPTSPNCYAYAIGSPVNEQPGGTSGCIPTSWNDVSDVGKSVEADLIEKGYTVRRILGPDAKVYDNEFKIALRVGTQPFTYDPDTGELYYDYHFMRQTDTGQWAEKHGYGGASVLHDEGMTPDTIPWTLYGVPYYDSEIIYYAVGN